jgi:hypothetical protein
MMPILFGRTPMLPSGNQTWQWNHLQYKSFIYVISDVPIKIIKIQIHNCFSSHA